MVVTSMRLPCSRRQCALTGWGGDHSFEQSVRQRRLSGLRQAEILSDQPQARADGCASKPKEGEYV